METSPVDFKFSLVSGLEVLENPYLNLSKKFGDKWQDLCESEHFIYVMYGKLLKYLRENYIGLETAVIAITNSLQLFVDGKYWCYFETTRFGLDLYDIHNILIESIYCMDTETQDVAC